jgi:predicted AlkP superfamily pyrophosphatase or phosphodiesterase
MKNKPRLHKLFSSILLFGLCLHLPLFRPDVSGKEQRLRLVILIAVDGLGADILGRYDSLFTGGFRRLRDQGMSFTNAMVNHALTISHPGHVTLSTGMNPSRHGIVDAAFYQREGGRWRFVDAVRDDQERIIGFAGAAGASPRNILVSALPEWIVSADPQARFVAVGTGRYSSLLHACRMRGDVYWFDNEVGRYVTSSYYRQDYPDWVDRFNREELPRYIESSAIWRSTVPPHARRLARRDDAPYEGYEGHTSFPHYLKDAAPKDNPNDPKALSRWFKNTPTADAATLALAKEAIRARSLGQRGSTDYLSIVVSQVDDISHSYGSGSQEQLDNLLRLDRELGDFLKFLDKKVGEGHYLVALSADHGMMDMPEYQREIGQPGRRITEEEINAVLREVSSVISRSPGTREETAARVAKAVKRYDFVADAMTPKQMLGASTSSDPFVTLYRNSYSSDRVPRFPLFDLSKGTSPVAEAGVVVRLVRGAIVDLDRAVHGSPYEYDRHVPLIFMGYGIRAGSSAEPVGVVDVAPTLARLAGINFPSGLDGRPLLVKRPKKE